MGSDRRADEEGGRGSGTGKTSTAELDHHIMHMYHLQESGIASRFTYKLDEYFRHRDMTCECEERPGEWETRHTY